MKAPALLTRRDVAALPRLYTCEGQGLGAQARVRLFLPGQLAHLTDARGPYGARVERDRHWRPRPLAECLKDEGREDEWESF